MSEATGCVGGFTGPVGLHDCTIVVDSELPGQKNLCAGACRLDHHIKNVNYGRDYNGTERLGTAPITAERSAAPSYNSNTFLVSAVLQNYAYNKNVFVRYTTDNWRTYKDQALNYSNTYDDGTECWKTVISDYYGAFNDNFQYALCYQVNGQEYWANNFGANYNGSFYIHH